MRLNKYLSLCGVASRRAADDLIATGRVAVNGEVISALGTVIDESADKVDVDGKPARPPADSIYLMLNKPTGYLVTLKDDFGRKTIKRLVRDVPRRVYPVGRLDLDSEGLLILTDNGEMAFRLAHPSFGIRKVYEVRVKGDLRAEDLRHFFDGIELEDGYVAKGKAKILDREEKTTLISIELTEGKKREIRRMCKAIGYPVVTLNRVRFDELSLHGLEKGKWRYLSPIEIQRLKKKVGLE